MMNRHKHEAVGSRLSALGSQDSGVKTQDSRSPKPPLRGRRAFNLIELLLALSISALLLTATMVALRVSFMAYQSTTEVASTHTIGRLTMHRVLALIRTGSEFGPVPADPHDTVVMSNEIFFRTPGTNAVMRLEWREDPFGPDYPVGQALYIDPDVDDANPPVLLLEGVVLQLDGGGDPVPPFTLEYERGRILYRATVDLAIVPDDNMSVTLDGDNQEVIRLVASAMPRRATY